MKKKNLDLKFRYQVDEKNRCVICWLSWNDECLCDFLDSSVDFIDGLSFFSGIYLKNFIPASNEIKAIAKAHPGDIWDPEGLKKLAHMKAERSFYKRMATAIKELEQSLLKVSQIMHEEEEAYSRWYESVNQKIVDPKFYEKWRTKD